MSEEGNSRCQSCDAPIVWRLMRTKDGSVKTHPFDAKPKTGWVENSAHVHLVAVRVFTSHFATCPSAAEHRRQEAKS